jgi:hypothetical protein
MLHRTTLMRTERTAQASPAGQADLPTVCPAQGMDGKHTSGSSGKSEGIGALQYRASIAGQGIVARYLTHIPAASGSLSASCHVTRTGKAQQNKERRRTKKVTVTLQNWVWYTFWFSLVSTVPMLRKINFLGPFFKQPPRRPPLLHHSPRPTGQVQRGNTAPWMSGTFCDLCGCQPRLKSRVPNL